MKKLNHKGMAIDEMKIEHGCLACVYARGCC